ncbi:MAG TPA: hypothetical protein VFS66_02975 [Acidimicrobiia bacterium]|nr:hypothetical protein [Acidimicrobiia bacterium]
MKRTDTDVDGFLAGLHGKRGDDMRLLDAAIQERMPNAERHLYEGTFWGGSDQQIVGYGVLDYENKSGENVEWFLLGIAEQKNYLSMYVNAVDEGEYLLRQYEKKLGKAKVGSASVSFDSVDDLDLGALFEMIDRAAESV